MSKSKVVTARGRHNIPVDAMPLIEGLESQDYVERVGIANFIHKAGVRCCSVRIQYYNSTNRTYRLAVYVPEILQNLYVRVREGRRDDLERYVKNFFNH